MTDLMVSTWQLMIVHMCNSGKGEHKINALEIHRRKIGQNAKVQDVPTSLE